MNEIFINKAARDHSTGGFVFYGVGFGVLESLSSFGEPYFAYSVARVSRITVTRI